MAAPTQCHRPRNFYGGVLRRCENSLEVEPSPATQATRRRFLTAPHPRSFHPGNAVVSEPGW